MIQNQPPSSPSGLTSTVQLPCGRQKTATKKHFEKDPKVLDQLKMRLENYVQEQQLKRTEARLQIIEFIFNNLHHFTVSDLTEKMRANQVKVGPATVYRNLPILKRAGIIKETLTHESGQKVYEISLGGHHDHIVCLDCEEIFEFHEEVIEDAQDKLAQKMKFKPSSHRHVIYAQCVYKSSQKAGK
jgi:Fur family transcriptional regulator, ferric uptake regulator